MDEEQLNIQIRKFLKKVGINSQREIEQAVREAAEAGSLTDGQLDGKTIEALKDHSDDQLIVLKAALDTTKKFELQAAFQDNLWVV